MNRRSMLRIVSIVMVLATLMSLTGSVFAFAPAEGPAVEQSDWIDKIEPGLRDSIQAAGQGQYLVYLTEQADLSAAYEIDDWSARGRYVYDTLVKTAQTSQAKLLGFLAGQQKAGAVADYESHFIANLVLVTSGLATLDAVAQRSDVSYIELARTYTIPEPQAASPDAIEWGVQKIRAPEIWADFNARGEGVVVANIDTGVLYTHAALEDKYRGTYTGSHDFNWYDPSNICPGDVPCDNHNHGTHTMGTMVGDDGGANQIGVAPGARWIAAKGCESGSCSSNALLKSAEWIAAPCPVGIDPPNPSCDPDQRPDLVNNSWGGGGGDPWYQGVVDAWQAAGIVPIFSAGNSGPGASTIGSPGDYCNVIGVGATDINDNIASFSSRGPGDFSGCTDKPDVSAPGVNVRSSIASGGYGNFNGTSMAAPHTAGCVALLLSIEASLTYDEIYDLLTTTGVDLGAPGFDYNYGYGRIDCYEAAAQLSPDFRLSATPASQDVCAPDDANYTVNVAQISGFSDPVTLSASGVPAGYSESFSVNPVTPPGTSALTLSGSVGATAGSYAIEVLGVAPTSTHTTTVGLNLFDGPPGAVTLVSPPDGAVDVPTSPTFEWSAAAGAGGYYLEVATDEAFSDVVYSADEEGTSHAANFSFDPVTTYYWRVTPDNACGVGSASAVFSFTTANVICRTPNLAIPDGDPAGAADTMTISDPGYLGDLNVYLRVSHTWVGDLRFTLRHVDSGATVTIIDRPGVPASSLGCSEDDIDATLDDEAALPVENECAAGAPTIDGTFTPNFALSAFDGKQFGGTWEMRAFDLVGVDVGTLDEWCLEPTYGEPPPCAATVALEEQPSGASDLATLRQFRDEVMANSAVGQRYTELYYEHSPEVVWMLLKDAELRARTVKVLGEFLPGMRALLGQAEGREIVLTAARVTQAQALLDDLAERASPELQAVLAEAAGDIASYQGKPLRAMWLSPK